MIIMGYTSKCVKIGVQKKEEGMNIEFYWLNSRHFRLLKLHLSVLNFRLHFFVYSWLNFDDVTPNSWTKQAETKREIQKKNPLHIIHIEMYKSVHFLFFSTIPFHLRFCRIVHAPRHCLKSSLSVRLALPGLSIFNSQLKLLNGLENKLVTKYDQAYFFFSVNK